jgi:hypothetical protein
MQSGYDALEMKIQNRLMSSHEKAFRFIEASRNPSGLWSDFLTLARAHLLVDGVPVHTVFTVQRDASSFSLFSDACVPVRSVLGE